MPDPCLAQEMAVAGAEQTLANLQEQLHHAAGGEKISLIEQIVDANKDLHDARAALTNCLSAHPPPPELVTTLAFDITLEIPSGPQAGTGTIPGQSWVFTFSPYRDALSVPHERIITPPIPVPPLGNDELTLDFPPAGGSFDPETGSMALTVQVNISHSLPLAGSTLQTVLTTNPPGSRMTTDGQITLSGGGTLQGGVLNGTPLTASLSGKFSEVP